MGQLLCPKCNNGPLVLHEQPIGVVGFHSVHTRYVITVSLYIVFNLLTKIIAYFFSSELLERCTRMRTTNPNESFNIQAWRRTPKDLLVTKTVSTAVLEYNKGTNELPVVFNMLDIRDGYYFALHATSSSRKRRMDASRHANETSKKRRLRRKLFKPGQAYEHASKERVVISRRLQLLEMCDLYTLHHYIIFFSHLLYDNCSSATNI